jgi:hypothetical protein
VCVITLYRMASGDASAAGASTGGGASCGGAQGVYALGNWSLKAGMKSMVHSKEHIAAVISKASAGGKYASEAAARDAALHARCEKVLQKVKGAAPQELAGLGRVLREYVGGLEGSADFSRVCVVIDFDAFFCAVAERDCPELKGTAFGVGSGVLTTSSYEARRYGVRSALPTFIARELCPHLKVLPCDFEKYQDASSRARGVLERFDPSLRTMSLDEFFCDITDYFHAHRDPPPSPSQRSLSGAPGWCGSGSASGAQGEGAGGGSGGGGGGGAAPPPTPPPPSLTQTMQKLRKLCAPCAQRWVRSREG